MDKRNQFTSYLDGSQADVGRPQNSATRSGRHPTGSATRYNNANHNSGKRNTNGGIYSSEEEEDAVANHNTYKKGFPSNPRNSATGRAGQHGDINSHSNSSNFNSNNNRMYPTEDRQAQPSSSRSRRQLQQLQPQQPEQPPRLAYYNDGENANGSGETGYTHTPRPATARSNNKNNNTSDSRRRRRCDPNDMRSYKAERPSAASNGHHNNDNDNDLVDSRLQTARGRAPLSSAQASARNRRSPRQRRPQPPSPSSAASRRARQRAVHRERDSGLVLSPEASRVHEYGDDDRFFPENDSFDDYESPAKRANSRYGMGTTSALGCSSLTKTTYNNTISNNHATSSRDNRGSGQRPRGPAEFLVRIHRVMDAFSDLVESGRPAPTTFLSVHTTEERGRTGVVAGEYNPTFNDEFLFSSSRPEKDAVVLTLVAAAHGNEHPTRERSSARDKRVAEAVVSLQNLQTNVERTQWISLVRHPGTEAAYERGEVLISVITPDYGQARVPTEEEEGVYYDEVHDLLVQYAPEELHRLDWMVGNVTREGPEGLARLQAQLIESTLEPFRVRVTIDAVSGLMAADGRPTQAETCYVVLSTHKGSQMTTKTVPYRRQALFGQTFVVKLRKPEVDAVSLTVYSTDRKIGETLLGLANVQAGVPKPVRLLLVRAADTGDAAPAGEVAVTVQTEDYSSPYHMGSAREAQLRARVLGYLWCYLRDDLHRLDAIVAGIDDEDAYMQEWSRTIGPEKRQRHASLRIRRVLDAFGAKAGEGRAGSALRCYMRVVVGPQVQRTELATFRNGEMVFKTPIDITVYDPQTDSVELMVVEEDSTTDMEVSRVVLGTAGLPRGESVVRTVKLVANAATRSAKTQGELEVELVAHDFGMPPGGYGETLPEDRYRYLCDRLEAVTARNSPETLHRVPFLVDSAPPGQEEAVVDRKTKEYGGDVASAPMTVRVLGMRDYGKKGTCYVKAYLDGNAILTTRDKKATSEVAFDIADDNETTVKLDNATQARLTFKLGQHHRGCQPTTVIARTELALRGMARGEKNIVWVPLFEGSEELFKSDDKTSNGRQSQKDGGGADEEPFTGNKLPGASARAVTGNATNSNDHGAAKQIGQLGVMVQSMAFIGSTVTEYTLDSGKGRRGNGAEHDKNNTSREGGGNSAAYEAVTHDVTTLLMKYRPQDLPKVQPLIAECSSIKDAHHELRERFCPRSIGATVYVTIEKIEMTTADGRAQEKCCGVLASVHYGDEVQPSRKRLEFEHNALQQRMVYPTVRLDIPSPGEESGDNNGSGRGSGGVGAESNACATGRRRVVSHQVAAAPPLEIRLTSVRGAAGTGASSSFAGGTAGGGGRGNGSTLLPPRGGDSPSRRRSGSVYSRERQQTQEWQQSRAGFPLAKRHSKNNDSSNNRDNEMNSSATNRRHSLGGRNNLMNYLEDDTAAVLNSSAVGAMDTSATDFPYAYRSTYNKRAGSEPGGAGSQDGRSSGRLTRWEQQRHQQQQQHHQGEIGFVQLSLRALLSAPLHTPGDLVRVPIVRLPRVASYGQTSTSHLEDKSRSVVGHITLRVSLPAFATVPEWLRLGSRSVLNEVEPDYVHYYERRIGAYLLANSPADLVSFHYKFYERDVATGRWPVALDDWLQALVKRFGPETTNVFGREPPLSFDPEERERMREQDAAARRRRESAFANSEANSIAPASEVWLGDEAYVNYSGGRHSEEPDIYELHELDEDPRTEPARPHLASGPSSHSQHQQQRRSADDDDGESKRGGRQSTQSQSQRRRKAIASEKTKEKAEEPVFGF